MEKKLATERFIEKAKKIHGDFYNYSQVEYKSNREKIKITCPIHGEFNQRASNHLEGRGCHICGGFSKKTTEDFIKKAKTIHGNRYDYSKVVYKGIFEKIIIVCFEHGEFIQTPANHFQGSGCSICAIERTKRTKEQFIKEANKIHNNKYTYLNLDYKNDKTKILIQCPQHGEFYQTPNSHLGGHGCPLCSNNKKSNTDEFIRKAIEVHGDRYNYSKTIYNGANNNVKIICPEHGEFEQVAYIHLKGAKCSICMGKNQKTTEQFINESNNKYNSRFDYSKTNYIKAHDKVIIICPKHGEFEQTPDCHLRTNNGCPMCAAEITVSSIEKEIIYFLKDDLNIQNIKRNKRNIITPKELDIFLPEYNVAIEFDGLYYHSELFQKDKKYHLNKTELCQEKNIRLVHIFEDEWNYKKEIVKSRLINILDKTIDKIYARKTIIKEIDVYQAKEFFNKNHLQGYTNSKYKIGLFYDGKLVSCMLFNNPRVGIGTNYDGYELTRFASVLNINVVGGANKILKYFENTYKPKLIKSYADRRWGLGKIYNTLGFSMDCFNEPNYWYIINNKRKHRFGFRKEILKKQGFDTKNKTEHQIMLERKIYRIYDCGTITYVKNYSLK